MKKLFLIILIALMGTFFFGTTVHATPGEESTSVVTFDSNGGEYTHHYAQTLNQKLTAGESPAVVSIVGDSTGASATTKWFHDGFDTYRESYLDYSFIYKYWDSTSESYSGSQKVMQYGSDGDAYALLTNASGQYISTPDSAALSITGDIDLRMKVKITETNGTTGPSLIFKGSSYWFTVGDLDGRLTLYWSEDGVSFGKNRSSGITSVLSGDDIWVRVTLDVDNGSSGFDIAFYTSSDGVTWTQNGTTYTGSGVTNIFDTSNQVEIGPRATGTQNTWSGRIYTAEIRSGINGKVVGSPDLDMAFPSTQKTFKDSEGNTWTINGSITNGHGSPGVLLLNGSFPGAAINYAENDTRRAKLIPISPDLVFINFSHNEDLTVDYASRVQGLADDIITDHPLAGIVLSTQNPQKSPRSLDQISAHEQRNFQIRLVASANEFGLIDAFKIISDDMATLVSSDGVHPSTEGYSAWATALIGYLSAAEIFEIEFQNGSIIQPNDPTKDAHTFYGWYTNANSDLGDTNKWDFSINTVSSDITLYAKYLDDSKELFVIDFSTNGGTTILNRLIQEGETMPSFSNPTRTGYVFSGWYTDPELTDAFVSDVITSDLSLYAKWTASGGGIIIPEESNETITYILVGLLLVAGLSVLFSKKSKKRYY